MGANTKDTGDETEARVPHELVSCGDSVSVPFGDDDKYDLIVDDGEIGAFVVRYPESEGLYWADIDDAAGKKTMLRFEAEIDHPSVDWASEYEFTGEIPYHDRTMGSSEAIP